MKNKEKYAEHVLTFACDDGSFGVYEKTGEMERCTEMRCKECLFHGKKETCHTSRRKWLESEYAEKLVISKMDRAFLEYLGEEYKFVARDENGELFAYKTQPRKWEAYCNWIGDGRLKLYVRFNVAFPMVKWENDEPWLIEDLKKLEGVEDYE